MNPITINDEELNLINRFTKSALKSEDVFTFSVILCDNEIDRDIERFDEASLKALAEMFVGKTGIFDHSMKSGDQIARVYSTEVSVDNSKKTSLGDSYTFVKAKCYMPRTNGNSDLIKEIEAGIKKEVSISCSVEEVLCSVCGTNLKTARCEHRKGKTYGGKICHSVLKNPTDAYEWSFVAVPAQKGAGVTKSFKKEVRTLEKLIKSFKDSNEDITLNPNEARELSDYISALKKKAHDGELYRKSLQSETVKFALVAMPQMRAEVVTSVCEKLSTEDLAELKSVFENHASEKMPVKPQLARTENYDKNDNNEFKI